MSLLRLKSRLALYGALLLVLGGAGILLWLNERPARAAGEYVFGPVWSPPVVISNGNDAATGQTVQISGDSRMIPWVQSEDGRMFVEIVKDDGTRSSHGPLSPEFAGFVEKALSDKAGGAYIVRFRDQGVRLNRVGGDGADLWNANLNNPVGNGNSTWNFSVDDSGNGLYAASVDPGEPQSVKYILGSKIRRSDGFLLWGGGGLKWLVQNTEFPNDEGGFANFVYHNDSGSDGQGGMVILAEIHFAEGVDGTDRNIVRRFDENGNTLWTTTLPFNPDQGSIRDIVVDDGSVFVIWLDMTDGHWKISRLQISDGSTMWVTPLDIGSRWIIINETHDYVTATGNGELTYFPFEGNQLYVNRVEISTKTRKWDNDQPFFALPADRRADFFSGVTPETMFVRVCDRSGSGNCWIQGVDKIGALIFPSPVQIDTNFNTELRPVGFQLRVGPGGATQGCINHVFDATFLERSRVQMYCPSLSVSAPECSLDGGATFGSCDQAQVGSLVTHVRSTCDSVPIDEVRFTGASPTGEFFVDQRAANVSGDQYTLHFPFVVNAAGDWSLSVECTDTIGDVATNQTGWAAGGSVPSSDPQKLSLYDGTARWSDGDTLEIGSVLEDANVDLLSTGRLYLRPTSSEASTFFEGLAGTGKQRLQLFSDADGKPALEAVGIGGNGQSWVGAGVHGRFNGTEFNSGGSAVYGEVVSCGGSRTCYGGYFENAVSGPAILVTNDSAAKPALEAKNLGGGPAGQFIGVVESTADVSADANDPDNCVWQEAVGFTSILCPSGKVVSGLRYDASEKVTHYQCCHL